ncbi:putative transmembrane protein [Phytophthora cinnamomi]|uniref:putative transmembrane protein n=1 Tax=Phytophthora cinnamomi TaxID=4785 RepID=UPI003559A1EB|nr:putative transmembrane protein [Phytophthora cinnamomi]
MVTKPVMRPSNFRHDMRGAQVVEIRREEYERTKRSILKKIRRRLVILGVIIGLLSIVAFTLGGVIRGYNSNILKFHSVSGNVSLVNLYFIYAAVSLVFSFHGFYIDGKWRKLQQDGNRLILHVRTFFVLGVGSWALALWLGIATLSAFGLVEVQYIASSSPNLIYLTTLVTVTVHLVVSPWLLRTIHRKGSQADEFFGAEFLSDINPRKQNASYDDDDDDDASDSNGDHTSTRAAAVQPVVTSPRGLNQVASQRKPRRQGSGKAGVNRNRNGFFNAEGNASMSHLQLAMEGEEEPPRSVRRQSSPRSVSPRVPASSTHAVVEVPPTVETQAYHQIPFASPVFLMDPEANLHAPEFWQLWKQTETTGAFSCSFANQPTRADLERHLEAHGFHIVTAEQKDSAVLQVYFYGSQYGTDTIFLCEFVLLFARRFFQATFKCKDRDSASDFVTRFNLQELLIVEGE